MILYHATPINNMDNIDRCGLQPCDNRYSNFDRDLKQYGVYGFTAIKDAIGFAKDQCWSGGVAIYSFNADDNSLILDPEYDDLDYGTAYFYPTEDSVNVTLVQVIEY
ncbi:MAG: hypothetical protein ACM3QW_05720 [Ignavibacteriales bacterium]